MQSINTVCICGAGTMGNGIAQVCATAGHQTILYDINDDVLKQAKSAIQRNLGKLVAKKKIDSSEAQNILERIRLTSNIENCIADLVIEAIVEKPEPKISLFNQLSQINSHQTIFATNTSSLSVSKIAESLKIPANFIGLHFFNPAPLMQLVEIIKTNYTSHQILETVIAFVAALKKVPVVCKDSPGFIVNRVARPYYIEALRIAEEGIDIATIDKLLESRGFKLGSFKLMDVIGNDVNYAVSISVYHQLNQPERLKPSHIQKEKVEKGEVGKKTGAGYYKYPKEE